jgi:hypothetical protein
MAVGDQPGDRYEIVKDKQAKSWRIYNHTKGRFVSGHHDSKKGAKDALAAIKRRRP